MKKWANSTVIASALLYGLTTAQGQPMDWEKQTYLTVLSLKVLPGQANAIAEHYKSGPGAKTIQARIKANPKLLRWSLLRNVYPGDTGAEAEYLIGIAIKGAPSGSIGRSDQFR